MPCPGEAVKLTTGELVIAAFLFLALSVLVQFAVAKWLYERKRRRLARDRRGPERPPPPA